MLILSYDCYISIWRDAKMNFHAPVMNELDTFADQQREWEVKTSQVFESQPFFVYFLFSLKNGG